jgi:hypothetical protein
MCSYLEPKERLQKKESAYGGHDGGENEGRRVVTATGAEGIVMTSIGFDDSKT